MRMIASIEKNVRAGRNLGAMRILLTAAAALLPPLAAFSKLSILIFEGRLLIEYHARRPQAAEDLLVGYARHNALTFWAVSTYVTRVVEPGHARRLQELIANPELSPGAAALLRTAAARLHDTGRRRTVTATGVDHERLAEDGLAFMQAEPDQTDLTLAMSTALSAEACDREDIFGEAIAILLRMIERMEQSRDLSRRHLADIVTAKLTLFDVEGAESFLLGSSVAGMKKAEALLAEVHSIAAETASYRPAMRMAHEDMLARAGGARASVDGRPVVLLPAAAFRKNRIDYPGFRSDIRFALSAIVAALDAHGVSYSVKSRLRTHGVIDLPVPFFAYHTVSGSLRGLHFKETDRPSLFSFDRRGYAGWSEFSETGSAPLVSVDAGIEEARSFFDLDKKRVIGGNLSKYRQADLTDADDLPERFVFVALQVVGDAVSELAYLSLFEMVDEVVRVAASLGMSVVVKRHPLCTSPEVSHYLADLLSRGAILQVYSSIHAIIPKSEAVCVVNSGVGAEALLHEKPVYVFGRADYMGGCFICRQTGDFAAQFVPGKARLSPDDLRLFWYRLRHHFAVDLRDRKTAARQIEARVTAHLKLLGTLPEKP